MTDPRPDPVDVNVNDVVAFLIEIAALVMLAVAGARTGGSAIERIALATVLPAVAIALWALFAAPRARMESPALRLLTKIVVLGAGVVAAFVVVPTGWAVAIAVVVAVNLLLMYVGPLARRPLS